MFEQIYYNSEIAYIFYINRIENILRTNLMKRFKKTRFDVSPVLQDDVVCYP